MRNMMAMKVSFREKVDKELDAEALRVVCLMPKWIPEKKKKKIRNQNFTCLFWENANEKRKKDMQHPQGGAHAGDKGLGRP